MTLSEAASIVGVLCGVMTLADYLIRRWLQNKHDETIRLLHTQLTEARKDRDEQGKQCEQIRSELKELQGSHDAKASHLVVANHRVASLEEDVKAKDAHIGELSEVQAALDKQQKTHDTASGERSSSKGLSGHSASWRTPRSSSPSQSDGRRSCPS